jgi:hypothetical protein
MKTQTATRRSRETGMLVTVGHSETDGWETDPTCRWYTLCEEHGFIVFHDSLFNARGTAPHTSDWCEGCQAN